MDNICNSAKCLNCFLRADKLIYKDQCYPLVEEKFIANEINKSGSKTWLLLSKRSITKLRWHFTPCHWFMFFYNSLNYSRKSAKQFPSIPYLTVICLLPPPQADPLGPQLPGICPSCFHVFPQGWAIAVEEKSASGLPSCLLLTDSAGYEALHEPVKWPYKVGVTSSVLVCQTN